MISWFAADFPELAKQYVGVAKILKRYLCAYGGKRSLLLSPYLHASVLIAALCFGIWQEDTWTDIVTGSIPDLLGFTLGGFAIFIGFSDKSFIAILKKDGNDNSPYVKVTATFTHFIVVQLLSLIYALLYQSAKNIFSDNLSMFASFFGFFIFIYALFMALAAALALFRISTWYNKLLPEQATDD